MTFPDVHLAGEAVVAFVDGELASFAQARAVAHLDICAECQRAVRAQQETSRLLAGASDPDLPAGLLGRLREIPMTAELDGPDVVLAVEGGDLVWGTPSSLRTRPVPAPHDGKRSRQGRPGRPDPGRRRDNRPASYPSARQSGRTRRARRALAGAVAGLAFGVCVATASMSVYSHTNTPNQNLIRDVNGGVIRPPVTGELTGVHNLRAPDPGRDGPDRTGTGRSDPQRTSLPSGSRTHGGTVPIGPSSSVTIGNGRVESVSGAGMR